METSGCAAARSPSAAAMSPSPRSTRSDWDSIGGPPVRVGSTLASIASKIVGTPAMTWTLPSVKPGAAEIGLSIRDGPIGHTGHAQAGVVHLHPLPVVMGLQDGAGVVANVQMRAHRLRHGIGGDVVMGRADPAGGEEVIVARRQRAHRRDDPVMHVGHDAHLLQPDAMIGQRLGEVVHVRVAGAARQDLVPDHQHGGGGHGIGLHPVVPRPLASCFVPV
jgi:hypothetical protein